MCLELSNHDIVIEKLIITHTIHFITYMFAYVQHLTLGWTKILILVSLINWMVQIIGKIMINTKWGRKSNGNKFIYTKAYNLDNICRHSCGSKCHQIFAYLLMVNPFKQGEIAMF
jgi:hypothetical protein